MGSKDASNDASTPNRAGDDDRLPQYSLDNLSAAQRGQSSSSEALPLGQTVDDLISSRIEVGWEMVDPTLSVTNGSSVDTDNDGSVFMMTKPELSADNVHILNMLHDKDGIYERMWSRAKRNRPSNLSNVNHPPATRRSNDYIDLVPVSADSPDSNIFGIGAWVEAVRPPLHLSQEVENPHGSVQE